MRADHGRPARRGPRGASSLARRGGRRTSACKPDRHTSPSMLRLVTIPISNYCEKARWALERASMPYREERHVQGIHRLAAGRAGGGATVPVLVTPEGAIGESAEILDWVDRRLAPEHRLCAQGQSEGAEALAFCRRLDERLGPRGRRLMYVHMLAQRELMLRFNNA